MFDRFQRDDMKVIRSWFLLDIQKDRPRYIRAFVMWLITIIGMALLVNNVFFEDPTMVSVALYVGWVIVAASMAHLWGGVPAPTAAEIEEYLEAKRVHQVNSLDPFE